MKITFSFGKNWIDYVEHSLDDDKINRAKDSLLKYLPEQGYRGKMFVDIGCGSGIFSLSALRLGCKEIISFDVDKHSIEATKIVRKKFCHLMPAIHNWQVFEGSILDESLVNNLKGKGDIVYSWGVLHHTGSMYKAIENAAKIVKSDGYFIIAIYNKAPSSNFWSKVKKTYNYSPRVVKKLIVFFFFFYRMLLENVVRFKNKISGRELVLTKPQNDSRGMSVFYDLIDWLGGYPYEFASHEEIKSFVEKLGFKLIAAPTKIVPLSHSFIKRFTFYCTGCNEFVFIKKWIN